MTTGELGGRHPPDPTVVSGGWNASMEAPAREGVERICRVPDRYRAFTVPARVAAQRYRLEPDVLSALCDLGLPHRSRSLFDEKDLINAAFALRLPCPRFQAMRWWPRALVPPAEGRSLRYVVRIVASCPGGGCAGGCDVSHRMDLDGVRIRMADNGRDYVAVVDRTHQQQVVTDPSVTALIQTMAAYQFHLLPVTLAQDTGFARETKLANCSLAAQVLYEEAVRRDVRARAVCGVLVGAPFSTPHSWVEVDLDGRWTPLDPLLLTSLVRWGFLPAAQWPPARSPLDAFLRLRVSWGPLLLHGDTVAPLSFPTRRVL